MANNQLNPNYGVHGQIDPRAHNALPPFQQPNGNLPAAPPVAQEPIQKAMTKEVLVNLGRSLFFLILVGILLISLCYVVWTFIEALSKQAERIYRYISGLMDIAPSMFHSSRAFGAAVELFAIAIFVGFVLNRIINYNRRKR